MKTISAIILAAGFSSRLGTFKPLLRINGKNLLERAITLFKTTGIGKILVVTGHRSGDLDDTLNREDVSTIQNPDFKKGMFSSIVTGIKNLDANQEAFFILPVDIPLVRASTVTTLCRAFSEKKGEILYPSFQGTPGHPPLISTSLSKSIISWKGKRGLEGFLGQHQRRGIMIPVADEGILLDLL